MTRSTKSGRPRKTTARDDKLILRMSSCDPRKTATTTAADLCTNYGIQISERSVRRRLLDGGLNARRPVRKPLISKKNRKARLEFARRHVNWTVDDWAKDLWSDESKVCFFTSDGIQYVRRPVGTRFEPKYQLPTVKHGGGHVMVWGCFCRNGVGPLVRIEGTMDRFHYAEILQEHMLPFAKRHVGRGWLFQHDNDPKHASKHVAEWLQKQKVRVLEWPSQSPDLNPIEHLWDELGRRVADKKCTNVDHLMTTLTEEWNNIPASRLETLVKSMPNRCRAVINTKGYATKY